MPERGHETALLAPGHHGSGAARHDQRRVGLAGQFIHVHPVSRTVIVKLSYYPPQEPPSVLPQTRAFFRAVAHMPAPAQQARAAGQ
jgi:CubicO group peptidase (beta-lactamase class C family)